MKTSSLLSIAAAASLTFVTATGCEKRSDQTGAGETRTTSATGEGERTTTTGGTTAGTPTAGGYETPTTTTTTSMLSSDDRDFMIKAAQGSLAEVHLGTDIARRASSPEAKAFANRMITDHGKANEELKSLAMKKGVTLPTDVTKDHKDLADKLSKLSGDKLDKEYADEMIDDHEKDIKAFQKQAEDGKDPEVKAWAAKTLPILQDHLKQAKDFQMAEKAREGKAKNR